MATVLEGEEKLTEVGEGQWGHAWRRQKWPSEHCFEKQKWRKDNKASAFAAKTEPCILTASKARQGWEELQKLLTKLRNQTTMTEKVQCTQRQSKPFQKRLGKPLALN